MWLQILFHLRSAKIQWLFFPQIKELEIRTLKHFQVKNIKEGGFFFVWWCF